MSTGWRIQTPIADMVAQMFANGCAAEAIVQAIATAEVATIATSSGVLARNKRGERLPANWRLLEGMIAISGLMTFAWSTGVLFALAQEYQARVLHLGTPAAPGH